MQFQVWGDLFFALSSSPTWSILCHRMWTGATETCPFTSTWKKQWWKETNGDFAFMWGQIRNPVVFQAAHWHLSWYGWLPEEACLSHLPFCLGHKSTLDGDIQTGQISSPGGPLLLHQFWTYSFLSLPFGHAWEAAEPCKEGCWLEGRWDADRAGSGELRSRRTYLHEIPTFWLSLWLGFCLGLVPSDTVCSAGMLRAGWIGCLGPEPVCMACLALHCFSSRVSYNMCLLSWIRA